MTPTKTSRSTSWTLPMMLTRSAKSMKHRTTSIATPSTGSLVCPRLRASLPRTRPLKGHTTMVPTCSKTASTTSFKTSSRPRCLKAIVASLRCSGTAAALVETRAFKIRWTCRRRNRSTRSRTGEKARCIRAKASKSSKISSRRKRRRPRA